MDVMPSHHPPLDMLVDYASGALPEAEALIIASHISLCPECREEVCFAEAVGGVMLEEIEPAQMSDLALDRVLARLDEPAPIADSPAPVRLPSLSTFLPQPIADLVGGSFESLSWKTVIRGIEEVRLPDLAGAAKVALMRIRPGVSVPQHTHEGAEFTLVLSGGFSDARGHFERGDLSITGAEIDHRPVADAGEDCIVLAVTTAPLRLTGRFGRFLNPFVRM